MIEKITKRLEKLKVPVNEHTIELARRALGCGRDISLYSLIAEVIKEDKYRSVPDINEILGRSRKSRHSTEKHMRVIRESGEYPDVEFVDRLEKSRRKQKEVAEKRWEKDKKRVLEFCKANDNTTTRKISIKFRIDKKRVRGLLSELKTEQVAGEHRGINFPLTEAEQQAKQKKRFEHIAETYRKNPKATMQSIATFFGVSRHVICGDNEKMRELKKR